MEPRQNLIIISVDIFCKDDHGTAIQHGHAGNIHAELDKFVEMALQYLQQCERVILKNTAGVDIFYLGAAKEAMFMATEFRDYLIAKKIDTALTLYLRMGIHLENIDTADDNQVAPLTIQHANQICKRLKSQAKPNEILVSQRYFDHVPTSIQTIATVYEFPIVGDEAAVKSQLILDNAETPLLKRQNAPAANAKASADIASRLHAEEMQTRPRVLNLRFLNHISWRFMVVSVCVCLAVLIFYQFYFAGFNLHRTANLLPRAQKPLQAEQAQPVPRPEPSPAEPVTTTAPVTQLSVTKPGVKPAPDKVKNTQPAAGTQTFWNKLVNSMKQGKKSECTQAQKALNQCPKT